MVPDRRSSACKDSANDSEKALVAAYFAEGIRGGQQAGAVVADIDADFAANMLLHGTFGLIYLASILPSSTTDRPIRRRWWQVSARWQNPCSALPSRHESDLGA